MPHGSAPTGRGEDRQGGAVTDDFAWNWYRWVRLLYDTLADASDPADPTVNVPAGYRLSIARLRIRLLDDPALELWALEAMEAGAPVSWLLAAAAAPEV